VQLAPGRIVGALLAHRARDAVKLAVAPPKFAVQWVIGQGPHKPVGRRNGAATAKAQAALTPDGTHAVEFFAEQKTLR